MKKYFFVALAIVCSYATTFAQSKTPKAVETAFKSAYPNAKKVKWDKEDNNYEASFKLNNISNSVLFNQDGKILETEVEINFNELPKSAVNYINKNYKNQKVKETAKIITEKGNLIYEAEIKGKDLFFDSNGNFITKEQISLI